MVTFVPDGHGGNVVGTCAQLCELPDFAFNLCFPLSLTQACSSSFSSQKGQYGFGQNQTVADASVKHICLCLHLRKTLKSITVELSVFRDTRPGSAEIVSISVHCPMATPHTGL